MTWAVALLVGSTTDVATTVSDDAVSAAATESRPSAETVVPAEVAPSTDHVTAGLTPSFVVTRALNCLVQFQPCVRRAVPGVTDTVSTPDHRWSLAKMVKSWPAVMPSCAPGTWVVAAVYPGPGSCQRWRSGR